MKKIIILLFSLCAINQTVTIQTGLKVATGHVGIDGKVDENEKNFAVKKIRNGQFEVTLKDAPFSEAPLIFISIQHPENASRTSRIYDVSKDKFRVQLYQPNMKASNVAFNFLAIGK